MSWEWLHGKYGTDNWHTDEEEWWEVSRKERPKIRGTQHRQKIEKGQPKKIVEKGVPKRRR